MTPIDTASDSLGTPIHVGNNPYGIAITPNGATAYVTDSGSGTVTPIDTATNTAGTAIPVERTPIAITVTPDGATAYVVNTDSNTVTPIDTANNTAGAPIPVGNSPEGIAVSPDGTTAYVTNAGSGTVTPIHTATDTTGTPIPVGIFPRGIALTPDGDTAYVVNTGSNTVTPINTTSNTAETPIPVGSNPHRVAISPDGSTAYVTNWGSGTVTPINTATNTAGTPIPVGSGAEDIAFAPTPLDTSIDSHPVDPTASTTATFTFSATQVGSSFQCKLDRAGFSPCTSPTNYTNLADGSHTFQVRATHGQATDTTPASFTWTIASTAPDTLIDSHPVDPTASTTATFTFSANQVGSSFECKLDGAGFSTCTSPTNYTNLADGSHTFQVRATHGQATDATPASFTWTIDTTAPDTLIDSHPDNPTTLTDATFTFHATETSTFQCSLDNNAYSTCTSPKTYHGLTKRTHTFQVKATDTTGNTDPTPATYTWTNANPPTITITHHPARKTTKHKARFTFTTNDPDGTIQCSLDHSHWATCTSGITYTHLHTGRHVFRVQLTDAAERSSRARYRWAITRRHRR